MEAKVLASGPCRGDTQDTGNVSTQTGTNPGLSVHIESQLFIATQEEPDGGRQARCPSLPRPSAACVTAFVTVLVAVSATSFTTLSPDSWAFFKASAMAVGKEEEEECLGEQRKQVTLWAGVTCGMWQSYWVAPCGSCGTEHSAAPG